GHVVGARYGLQHGICHAILLAPAMRLLLPVIGDEQSLVCDALTRTKSAREANCSAASAAEVMAELVRRLPLRQRLREAGVQAGELAEIASYAMSDYTMAKLPKPLSQEEVLGLLRQAW